MTIKELFEKIYEKGEFKKITSDIRILQRQLKEVTYGKNWIHESIIHIKDKQGAVTKSIMLHVDSNKLKLAIDPLEIMKEEIDSILKQETQVIFKDGREQQYNFEFKNGYSFKIGMVSMLLAISKGEEPIIPMILCDYKIEDHGFVRIGG